jgi:serralysin
MTRVLEKLLQGAVVLGVLCATPIVQALPLDEVESNDPASAAQNINAFFSSEFQADIEAGVDGMGNVINMSDRSQHVTVNSIIDDSSLTFDFYEFSVAEAGIKGIFDIDNAEANNLDSYLTLFDTDGTTVLAENDDSAFDGPGDQLALTLNSFLTWTFADAGTYFIRVGEAEFCGVGCSIPAVIPDGVSYQLHVSLMSVPEPGSLALLAVGVMGAGLARPGRRRNRA